ncbi:MAG TPA: LamG-like jellyroll fold domain-containing protein [Dactylosporangium sp.]|nr:LamG-like jellyroll fold domain-containing protein [Dactylosporangium sp.]
MIARPSSAAGTTGGAPRFANPTASADTSTSSRTPTSSPRPANGYLASVFNAATGEVQLYINGVRQNSTGHGALGEASATSLNIGGRPNSSPFPFGGAIDDVHVYQGVLNDREIADIYAGNSAARAAGADNPCGIPRRPPKRPGPRTTVTKGPMVGS